MGLINQDNRTKQDLTHTRTPEDVMRRLAKNVQITTDEVKGLTVEVKGKVDGKEIISTINQSAEAVTIDASKININGTISANGNFKVDTSGNMTCNEATMKNATLSDDYGTLTLNHGIINLNDTYNSKWSNFTAQIGMTGISCRTLTGSGGILTPKYVYLLGEEDYGSIDDFYSYFQMGSMVNGSITEDRIKMYGRNGNITCVSLTQTSKEEEKKNFKKLENALDIVKDVDIYEYNLKFEKDTDKKHIGVVIGNKYKYREEITSEKNDGIDNYSMISVLWQAVKEQQKEIEELKKVIK